MADLSGDLPELMADPVMRLIVEGRAKTIDEAEEMYLDSALPEVLELLRLPMSDEELAAHPLMRLLRVRGSRPREDSVL